MKVSWNWIKELVDVPWTPEEAAEKLASLGFPAESITYRGVRVSHVVAVKILTVDKHPNADRLRIAKVTDGKQEHVIVCGAPNIAPGQVVPCARPGAELPGDIKIAVSKIRGVESNGMLCSERELGLGQSHEGIMMLPENAPLGKEVKEILGGQDTVLDIEITPNRPDLFSHIGIARELAALAKKPLKLPSTQYKPGSKGASCPIDIKEPSLCFRYRGKIFENVKVGPSPKWMVERLESGGIRAINNIVDITNYVLLEWGHPLHAFDLKKLNGPRIEVRKAKAGEDILALDGKTYKLDASDLVIADAKQPVAIAGVMGGEVTGVTAGTASLLLESAVFERAQVRRTAKRLALRTESSIRFEKGTDAWTCEMASARAAQLIQELAGATAGPASDVYPTKESTREIALRRERLNKTIGMDIANKQVTDHLKSLTLGVSSTSTGWTCKIPSYRRDLVEEIDLIEEVVRLVGYNAIPTQLHTAAAGAIPDPYRKWNETALINTLRGFGLSETITSSFVSVDLADKFGVDKNSLLALTNPLSQDETVLRPNLSLGLLKAAVRNVYHQRNQVALFEIGNVVTKTSQGPQEEKHVALLWAGNKAPLSWGTKTAPVDAYLIKGLIEALGFEVRPAGGHSFLHPHQAFDIYHRKTNVGWGGMLHPRLVQDLDLKHPCALAELSIEAFKIVSTQPPQPLPKFPFVERDIAIVIDKNKAWGEIQSEVVKAGGDLLKQAVPFDLFEGGSLAPTQKSLAFRVRLQHAEHTLSDAEISGVIDKIKSSLQKSCGAQLR